MSYSQEEWSWIEAEWAFHCHGRTAFISPEDFRQAKVWEEEGIPAEVIVTAMETYFERRARRLRPRAFVALVHIRKDVEKAVSFQKALTRAGKGIKKELSVWDSVKVPLKSDPRARVAFEAWSRLKRDAPSPESSGYLEHLDAEREAYKAFVVMAAEALGPDRVALETKLTEKLRSVDIPEGSVVWKRAWEHHFAKDVCKAWGLEGA